VSPFRKQLAVEWVPFTPPLSEIAMLWRAATLLAGVAHADDMTIQTAADVQAIKLTCGLETYEKTSTQAQRTASGGLEFSFPLYPGRECSVELTHTVGAAEQFGKWSCSASGCSRIDASGGSLSVPPNTVHVLWKADTSHNQLELTCSSGYRERVAMNNHEGTFSGVPDGDECTLQLKGGPPMKFRPLSPGAWECFVVSSTPKCVPR
jgi:hypothetical protein